MKKNRPSLFMQLSRRAAFFVWILVAATIAGYFSEKNWVADLFNHFRLQYVLGICLATPLLLISRRWLILVVGLVVLAVNATPLVPYLPTNSSTTSEKSIRILSMNLKTENRNYEKVVNVIHEKEADIVFLLEVNDEWADYVRTNCSAKYSYSDFQPQDHNFGIGVLSKIKWDRLEVVDAVLDRVPSYSIDYSMAGKSIQVIGTHPIPPMNSQNTEIRDQQLKVISRLANHQRPRIIAGDFNLTPWSPKFKEFLDVADVRDSALGFGFEPTWHVFPTWLGGLKIDHILVSDEIQIHNHEIVKTPGSDHSAVLVDCQIKDSKTK